jgi:TM2 domain-containing protein
VASGISDKSRGVALLLAGLLGPFGAHRFYTGRTRSGVLMALTLGGAGIWYLYDVIIVASGGFRDAEGRPVVAWDMDTAPRPDISDDMIEELDHLRREVGELAERLDFTERLLASARRGELHRPSDDRREAPPA